MPFISSFASSSSSSSSSSHEHVHLPPACLHSLPMTVPRSRTVGAAVGVHCQRPRRRHPRGHHRSSRQYVSNTTLQLSQLSRLSPFPWHSHQPSCRTAASCETTATERLVLTLLLMLLLTLLLTLVLTLPHCSVASLSLSPFRQALTTALCLCRLPQYRVVQSSPCSPAGVSPSTYFFYESLYTH